MDYGLMKKQTHLDVFPAGQASSAGSLGTQVSLCSASLPRDTTSERRKQSWFGSFS